MPGQGYWPPEPSDPGCSGLLDGPAKRIHKVTIPTLESCLDGLPQRTTHSRRQPQCREPRFPPPVTVPLLKVQPGVSNCDPHRGQTGYMGTGKTLPKGWLLLAPADGSPASPFILHSVLRYEVD